MNNVNTLEIIQPDDWHLHLRDGDVLKAVLPYSARQFRRAIIMPNLTPPVTTVALAQTYGSAINDLLPEGSAFSPLLTAYLTDDIKVAEIEMGYKRGIFAGAKLYPAGATTNSESGVTKIKHVPVGSFSLFFE